MTALKMSEAEWQCTVIDLAHVHGWKVAHFRPARTDKGWRTPVSADGRGFPDLVLVRDRLLFVELKNDAGRLTVEQRHWLDDLQAAGAQVAVWRPRDFDQVLETLKGGRRVG